MSHKLAKKVHFKIHARAGTMYIEPCHFGKLPKLQYMLYCH